MEHQRRGDVVRQVAEHAQRLAQFLGQLSKVHGHGVLLINCQLWPQERVRLQTRSQVAVQLDNRHFVEALTHWLSQCRKARTDFDHRLAFLWINSGNDAFNNELIVKEVLPEAFAG
ncbi:hypothetical protein D3C85_1493310 [compost metagenome]